MNKRGGAAVFALLDSKVGAVRTNWKLFPKRGFFTPQPVGASRMGQGAQRSPQGVRPEATDRDVRSCFAAKSGGSALYTEVTARQKVGQMGHRHLDSFCIGDLRSHHAPPTGAPRRSST